VDAIYNCTVAAWSERLTANANVESALGSILHPPTEWDLATGKTVYKYMKNTVLAVNSEKKIHRVNTEQTLASCLSHFICKKVI
jgi:hypothetical protein